MDRSGTSGAAAAFVRGFVAKAHEAWIGQGPIPERTYRFGSLTLKLCLHDVSLEPVLLPVIAHALAEGTQAQGGAITVHAIDAASGHFPAPPEDWPFSTDEADIVARTAWNPDEGIALVSDESRGIWNLFDASIATGLYWVRDAVDLPGWEHGSPLRHHLHWGSLATGQAMVHSAVVADGGIGVMLAGPGGSGKSTLTAAAISAGMATTGDDFVTMRATEAGWESDALFDIMKLTGMAEQLFGAMAALAVNPGRDTGEKALIPISAVAPGRFMRSLPVKAVMSCRLSGEAVSQIAPVSGFEIIRAISPSTTKILRTAFNEGFRDASRIARSLPCFEFRIGRDPHEAVAVLRKFMKHVAA